jgi:hypothetical protein
MSRSLCSKWAVNSLVHKRFVAVPSSSRSFVWAQVVDKKGMKVGNAFEVPNGRNVADFKKKVKEEKQPVLNWLAADDLNVYKNQASILKDGPLQPFASMDGLGKDVSDENLVLVEMSDPSSPSGTS